MIAYRERGSGPPLVLLHAFPLDSEMWAPQLAAPDLAMRLIAPDLPGFGASAGQPPFASLEAAADAVVALLDQLGLGQVALAGLSMGGYISFALLRRHAARVRALILADTRAGADTPAARERREANAQIAETRGMAVLAESLLPPLLAPTASEALRAHVRALMLRQPPAAVAAALRAMAARPDSTPDLTGIRVPTLVIVGADDVLTPPAEARVLHAGITGSQIVTIAGAGHLANLEQPEAFSQALQRFLGQ